MREDTYVHTITRQDGTRFRVLLDLADAQRVLDAADSWSVNSNGYAVGWVRATKARPKMHRVVLDLEPDDPIVDHRSGNRLDNRRDNLRPSDVVANGANRTTGKSHGRSRYRGVQWEAERGRWRARQVVKGRKLHVGYFDDEESAAAAVRAFREAHGLDRHRA